MSKLPSSIERSIKSEIERTKCPEHGEHPKVTFTASGFTVSCCCEKFRKDSIAKCSDSMKKALNQYILGVFKGLK